MGILKTFIHSTFREVGRNLGKGVSNELFGDWHSTPVRLAGRRANKEGWDLNLVDDSEYDVSVQPEIPREGSYIAAFFWGFIPPFWVLSIPVSIIAVISYMANGWLFKKTNIYAKVPMRRYDQRYSGGFREIGYTYVKLRSKRLKTLDEIKHQQIYALIFSSGVSIAFALMVYLYSRGCTDCDWFIYQEWMVPSKT
jgi:hypothetical protein